MLAILRFGILARSSPLTFLLPLLAVTPKRLITQMRFHFVVNDLANQCIRIFNASEEMEGDLC